MQQTDVLLTFLHDRCVSLLYGALQLVHAPSQPILSARLFTDQDHLAGGVVQRNVRYEETVARQPI